MLENVMQNETMRGVQFWIDAIKTAGIYNKIPGFNDVLTGTSKPGNDVAPVLEDVQIADKICDVYHWEGASRIYLYIKSPAN